MSYVNRVGEAWHGGGRDYANVELLAAVGELSNSSLGVYSIKEYNIIFKGPE